MATLQSKLQNAKALVATLEDELSQETINKKILISNKLCALLDNETYNGTINVSGENIYIESEYYDKYTEVYVDNCRIAVQYVCTGENGHSYVEDEDGNEHDFLDELTLKEVETIYNEVKDLLS